MLFQNHITLFFCRAQKTIFLKNVSTVFIHIMKVSGLQNKFGGRSLNEKDERVPSIMCAELELLIHHLSHSPLRQLPNVCVMHVKDVDCYSLWLISYFSMSHCVSVIDICCTRSPEQFSSPLL